MPGTINDPANRRSAARFSNTASVSSAPSSKTFAPLKLADDQPAIGRFFPTTCQTKLLANGDISCRSTGDGYAWTNLSKKVTFDMSGTIEYDQDFQLDGSTMYAYFRMSRVVKNDFKSRAIENPIANLVNTLSPIGDNFGKQLLSTRAPERVHRHPRQRRQRRLRDRRDRHGQAPAQAVGRARRDRITYENARSEVHQNERDFIGPISIEDDGRAIWMTATLDGVDAIDVFASRRQTAKLGRVYFQYGAAGALAGTPVFSDVMQNGVQWTRSIVLPKGVYYLVFDNTPTAGRVAPPVHLLDDRAATSPTSFKSATSLRTDLRTCAGGL